MINLLNKINFDEKQQGNSIVHALENDRKGRRFKKNQQKPGVST